MNKLIIGTLITITLSLSGWLYVGTCDDIKELKNDKANNALVLKALDTIEKQRIEDRLQQKEQRKEDQQDLKEQRAQDSKRFEELQGLIYKIITKP